MKAKMTPKEREREKDEPIFEIEGIKRCNAPLQEIDYVIKHPNRVEYKSILQIIYRPNKLMTLKYLQQLAINSNKPKKEEEKRNHSPSQQKIQLSKSPSFSDNNLYFIKESPGVEPGGSRNLIKNKVTYTYSKNEQEGQRINTSSLTE